MHDAASYVLLIEGIVYIALAGVVAAVRFTDRLNRTFAAYLVVHGLRQAMRLPHGEAGMLSERAVWAMAAMAQSLYLAQAFILLYLAFAFLERFSTIRWRRRAFWTLLLGGAALQLAVLNDRAWIVNNPAVALAVRALNLSSLTLLAGILGHTALRVGMPRARPLLLASAGFVFAPLAFALHLFIPDLMRVDAGTKLAASICFVPVAYVAGRLWLHWRRRGPLAAEARRYLVLLAAVGVSVVLLALVTFAMAYTTTPGGGASPDADRALLESRRGLVMILTMAVWFLVGAGVVAYAILRDEVFGVERGTHTAIRHGTLAAIFVACFLLATQLVEAGAQRLSDGLGIGSWVVGAVAAASLLFVLEPLQRAANRFAAMTVPEAVPAAQAALGYDLYRRMQLYEAAVRAAAEDGTLRPAERGVLERMRRRLGLAERDAAMVERAVLHG